IDQQRIANRKGRIYDRDTIVIHRSTLPRLSDGVDDPKILYKDIAIVCVMEPIPAVRRIANSSCQRPQRVLIDKYTLWDRRPTATIIRFVDLPIPSAECIHDIATTGHRKTVVLVARRPSHIAQLV